jgi:hypothetical protein
MEAIEVRALGCLLEDILAYLNDNIKGEVQLQQVRTLVEITTDCMQPELMMRPNFVELKHRLTKLVMRENLLMA